ncbi:ATP-binding cassette domain-containing protein [Sphingobacterium sp. DK4209]|uniref:ATP-binding cassette domain-containing protein n=1 Tax=Sphingobacterium zhuxiongii TaxID=2662364 RepID=A0A5Q0QEG3_9SPHI|nr:MULTISPECIES: ABC transporter ATP-binding protein [unclassified Sphingobacterium]MVZ65201.1 ATP-binding cassette domain-containing protein [Sphingobacterium sp. DK4209]QGA26148.1 ATP-binding cassette domain-containing protein [Sphingobacterium sp. dk4302]
MAAVSIDHIHKTFNKGGLTAVNSVSFDVKEAELFGIIGPDGAGKTTLFRILTTLMLPDSGAASVDGLEIIKDYKQIRKQVGYMPGKFSLYQDLTVEENLRFFASVFGHKIADHYDLIKDIYVQIEPFKDRRAGKLSGGMKQKLALCCALIHKPSVLFLDEPTTGVDAVSRKEFWEMLKRLKEQGISILVSTPYMDEANLCERIALMQGGSILSIDSPEGVMQKYPAPLYAVKASDMIKLLKDLRELPDISSCYAFGEYHHITWKNQSLIDYSYLENYLMQKGHHGINIKAIKPNIEDCFIQLMH